MPIGYPLVKAMDKDKFLSYFLLQNAFLDKRILFLCNYEDPTDESTYIAMLLYLQTENSQQPVFFYINSAITFPNLCFGLYDTILQLKVDIITICLGLAGGMSSLILAAGTKGQRFALPNSRIMMQEPQIESGVNGQATDLDIEAKELADSKNILINLYHERTGQTKTIIEKDLQRPRYFSATAAKEYGFIDSILIAANES
uniref:ATP-dependent Clp protease proteolytic subunit n=1 Tax=Cyanophora biloba TaxID=1489483 RepID=A0A2Z4HGD3_9EUKA|nr:ATP-dependent Clp protease proteolytic subunit [Cyanophora biloba]AWW13808.1 ATP-dependent Clp protease proteolytic subunit [Cyanophora biloba]